MFPHFLSLAKQFPQLKYAVAQVRRAACCSALPATRFLLPCGWDLALPPCVAGGPVARGRAGPAPSCPSFALAPATSDRAASLCVAHVIVRRWTTCMRRPVASPTPLPLPSISAAARQAAPGGGREAGRGKGGSWEGGGGSCLRGCLAALSALPAVDQHCTCMLRAGTQFACMQPGMHAGLRAQPSMHSRRFQNGLAVASTPPCPPAAPTRVTIWHGRRDPHSNLLVYVIRFAGGPVLWGECTAASGPRLAAEPGRVVTKRGRPRVQLQWLCLDGSLETLVDSASVHMLPSHPFDCSALGSCRMFLLWLLT